LSYAAVRFLQVCVVKRLAHTDILDVMKRRVSFYRRFIFRLIFVSKFYNVTSHKWLTGHLKKRSDRFQCSHIALIFNN